jgi:diguanylate cyclase (GGDEF)-like protein
MIKKKLGLIKNMRALLTISFIAIMFLVVSLEVYDKSNEFRYIKEHIRSTFLKNELIRIEEDVNVIVHIFEKETSRLKESSSALTKYKTLSVYSFIENLYNEFNGKVSEKQLKKSIINALRENYGANENYFFIRDLNGVSILNASMLEFEGKNYADIRDKKIRKKISAEIKFIKGSDEGVWNYLWTKPGSDSLEQKSSYLKQFKPFNWYIGTGDYQSDILLNATRNALLEVEKVMVGYSVNNFMLICDSLGNVLKSTHPTVIEGSNLDMFAYVGVTSTKEKIISIIKSDGDLKLWMRAGDDKAEKIAFAKGLSSWGIAVFSVSGSNLVDEFISTEEQTLSNEIRTSTLKIAALFIILIVVTLLLLRRIGRRLSGDFTIFSEFFKSAAAENTPIELNSVKYNEFSELAEYANSMLSEKLKAEEKLLEMATIDQLTGLYSRRYFLELAEQEITQCRRYEKELCFCMIDIDHFKNVNDTHGHSVGDLVLSTVTAECKNELRDSDIFGRIGGEEFVVVLPETDLESAKMVVERIRVRIENKVAIVNDTKKVSVTMSAGLCEVNFDDPSETLITVLAKVDELLYAAKNNGRNRVIVG